MQNYEDGPPSPVWPFVRCKKKIQQTLNLMRCVFAIILGIIFAILILLAVYENKNTSVDVRNIDSLIYVKNVDRLSFSPVSLT